MNAPAVDRKRAEGAGEATYRDLTNARHPELDLRKSQWRKSACKHDGGKRDRYNLHRFSLPQSDLTTRQHASSLLCSYKRKRFCHFLPAIEPLIGGGKSVFKRRSATPRLGKYERLR